MMVLLNKAAWYYFFSSILGMTLVDAYRSAFDLGILMTMLTWTIDYIIKVYKMTRSEEIGGDNEFIVVSYSNYDHQSR